MKFPIGRIREQIQKNIFEHLSILRIQKKTQGTNSFGYYTELGVEKIYSISI